MSADWTPYCGCAGAVLSTLMAMTGLVSPVWPPLKGWYGSYGAGVGLGLAGRDVRVAFTCEEEPHPVSTPPNATAPATANSRRVTALMPSLSSR
jgi:hypothetical protein